MEGRPPRVAWDLRNVAPGHMSIAGLTAFLAVAYRMRQMTSAPQTTLVTWNPRVFAFWDDISLFRLSSEFDLLRWPDALLAGGNRTRDRS